MRNGSFVLFLFFVLQAAAQRVTLLDADTGFPVANAAFYNTDKSKTSISDIDGRADLSLFSLHEKITIKHISYLTIKVTRDQIRKKGERVYLEVRPEQLDEVVMSVSKWEQQRKDIPQKIVSSNAQSLSFTNPQTAADLLLNGGQVFVQKSQLGGGSPIIRGFATNRVLLSVDGVRMNNAIFRGGNVQNVISIDPFTVKNTEIIFGPGSVIYGSDAIGGVMNFFTKEPRFSFTDSLAISGNANYRWASANNEQTAHVDFNLGHQSWASHTSITYNHFSDLRMGRHGPESYLRNNRVVRRNGEDVLINNTNPRIQNPSGFDQIHLMQKFRFVPSTDWDYHLGLHYSETSDYARYDRLIRPDAAGTGLRDAEWFYGPQKWLMANAQIVQKGKNRFYSGAKLTTAYQFFEESRNERLFQVNNRFNTRERLGALSLNLDFENKKIGALSLYYGAEYLFNKVRSRGQETNILTQETVAGPSRYPDGATWQTFAGYINGEYRAKPNITLLAGLRYSQVWVDAKFDDTFFPFPFTEADLITGALTGSLGASWFPSANLQLTLNGSTGFRAPNIDDIGKVFDSEPGAVVVPNPDLVPEYAYNIDFGLRANLADRLVFKAATYYTYLVDALVRRDFTFGEENEIVYNGELSRVQAIQNAANAYVYGLELGMEAFVGKNWSFLGNLTLTDGIEEDDDGMESPARHVAPTFADAHLIWKNDKFKADFFLNFNGEIPFEDLAFSERSKTYIYEADAQGNPFSPSWYTLNLRSRYQISNAFHTNLALENLTDQRYRTYSSGIVAPGVNLIWGLGYSF
ncbi:MAG: TonB-dependent receptor [Bacteroidota bacterium]